MSRKFSELWINREHVVTVSSVLQSLQPILQKVKIGWQNINKMKKKKLTEAKKSFKELASKLPLLTEVIYIGERVLGSRILTENNKSLDGAGKAIDPDVWYNRKVPKQQYMNHLKNLTNAFKSEGEMGVAKYIMKVSAQIEENRQRVALQEKEEQAILESATSGVPDLLKIPLQLERQGDLNLEDLVLSK